MVGLENFLEFSMNIMTKNMHSIIQRIRMKGNRITKSLMKTKKKTKAMKEMTNLEQVELLREHRKRKVGSWTFELYMKWKCCAYNRD